MTPDSAHSVSVAGVVVDGRGRALLIRRRDNGHWEPPGGVLEPGEDITAGLRREVGEETGLDIRPDALTGVYKNMSRAILALVFRCTPLAGTPAPTAEATAFHWATAEEVPRLATESYAVRVLDALHPHAPTPVRHHDGTHLLQPASTSPPMPSR